MSLSELGMSPLLLALPPQVMELVGLWQGEMKVSGSKGAADISVPRCFYMRRQPSQPASQGGGEGPKIRIVPQAGAVLARSNTHTQHTVERIVGASVDSAGELCRWQLRTACEKNVKQIGGVLVSKLLLLSDLGIGGS